MDKNLNPLLWLTALAAALRLPTLAIEYLWYDETFTAWLASLSWPALIEATAGDVHPPTWYAIEKYMVLLLGNSEFSLRLVSAIAGVALVPVVYGIAERLDFDRRDALWAAFLAATAPAAVYFSQEARPYSLMLLYAAIALFFLLDRRPLGLLFFTTALLYLHNLAVFSVAALGWLAFYRRDWRSVAALAAAGLLWLPWLVWGMLPQMADVINGFWVRTPTAGTPAYVIHSLVFSGNGSLLGLAGAPLLVIGLWRGWPAIPQGTRWPLLALLLLPIGLLLIASLLLAPVLIPRVAIAAAVPLYLWLAPALRRSRWLAGAMVALFVSFYGLYWGLPQFGRYPFVNGLDRLQTGWQANDAIYHANVATYITFHYYLADKPQYLWPQANDLSQSLTQRTKTAMGMQQAQFEAIACRYDRVWLAFYENPTTGPGERAEIERLQRAYHARFIDTILSGELYRARLYRIDNPCGQVALK